MYLGRALFGMLRHVNVHSTDRGWVNPFGSTVDDPVRIEAALARAHRHKRRAKIPAPGSYWEEPGHHGSGRSANLRGARGRLADFTDEVTGRWERAARRLPPMPRKAVLAAPAVAITLGVVGAVGVGALVWYLVHKRKQTMAASHKLGPAHVGDDMSGLELWGV